MVTPKQQVKVADMLQDLVLEEGSRPISALRNEPE